MLLGYAGLIAPAETIRIVFADPLEGELARQRTQPSVGQRTPLLETFAARQALDLTAAPGIEVVTQTAR
jgi:hypothetical protein